MLTMKRLNKLMLILAILAGLLNTIPLLKTNIRGVFFSVDPDSMYVGNTLSYIKMNQIHYYDHPGTPAIRIFAAVMAPIRFVAKYLWHVNFIEWSIVHLDYIFLYLKLLQNLFFAIGIFIFLLGIFKATHSSLSIIISWTALFAFSSISRISQVISAEVTSLLIVTVWLYLFSLFTKSRSALILIGLSFISGLALANRLTNLFVVVASMGLVFSLQDIKKIHKLRNLVLNIFVSLCGFLLGTWPIHSNYLALLNWATNIASTNETHGGGTKILLDPLANFQSLGNFVSQEVWAVIPIAITAMILTYLLIKKRIKFITPEITTFLIMLLGAFAFAKYPLTYYQLNNFLVLIFISIVIICKHTKFVTFLLIPLLLLASINKISLNYHSLQYGVSNAQTIDQFIKNHPPKIATLWEWGYSKDFAILWSNIWSSGDYGDEIIRTRPNLYSLGGSFQDVDLSYSKNVPLYSVCWDQLYIQKVTLPEFEKTMSTSLKITPIDNSTAVFVESNHCLPASEFVKGK